MKSKKQKSVALIISAVSGVLYTVCIIANFSRAVMAACSGTEGPGVVAAVVFAALHVICVAVAAVFNTIAALACKRGFALTGAILYCAGAALFFLYALFAVPSIILSLIGYAKLGKIEKNEKAAM